MTIQGIVNDVGFPAHEPFEEWFLGVIDNFGPRFEPLQLLCPIRPEARGIVEGAPVKCPVFLDVGLRGYMVRRFLDFNRSIGCLFLIACHFVLTSSRIAIFDFI
jgi:hypothetical protein